MRPSRLLPLLFVLAAPVLAEAKAWQGIDPGRSTQDEVLGKFGEPTTRTRRGSRTVLAYLGDQALPGTKQAQFHVGEDGTVQEITVFLATQLEKEAIEGTYGKPHDRTFTDDFLPVWIYRTAGVTVYFEKDGYVKAITFAPGAPKPAARPDAAASAPAAAGKVPARAAGKAP
jgi:hypothetical protein